MAVATASVAGKITAALFNALAKAINQQGLTGIIPTSVAGTGVSVSATGAVTFSGATTVSLNGVFTGAYDNYRITWNSTTRSASGSTQFRLRAVGTDVATNYDFVKTVASGTTATVTNGSTATGIPLDIGVAAGQTSDGVLDLYAPALARMTTGTAQSAVVSSSTLYGSTVQLAQEAATSWDGFTMFGLTSGETWSGTIHVFGYNNLA